MENTCSDGTWEWTVLSAAWAGEWAENKQFPYLEMVDTLAAEKCGPRCADPNVSMWKQP